jgi:hypothetical protein
MDDFIARIRTFSAAHADLLAMPTLALVAVLTAAWVAIPARRTANALSDEAGKIRAVIAASDAWVMRFQSAADDEPGLWQEAASQVQTLGVLPSERLTLAQIISQRAEDVGIVSPHIRFSMVDSVAAPPPRNVDGVRFNPANYTIQLTGGGGFGALNSLIGTLPPAVEPKSAALARDSSGSATATLTLSVFEPAGTNGK